ncbi:MAG TPA: hypothetical protein VFD06_15130, partial [Candidatus Polarisedimenticolia bacterium]|nr:hypothetical protein [Candidatus Polarisedimenticolia bacterium]
MSLVILVVAASSSGALAVPDRPVQDLVTRFANLATTSLPRDFVEPEGRTRWDLRALTPRDRFIRNVTDDLVSLRLVDDEPTGPRAWRFVDPDGGDAALRLLRPDRQG